MLPVSVLIEDVRRLEKEPISLDSLRSVTLSYLYFPPHIEDLRRVLEKYGENGFKITPHLQITVGRYNLKLIGRYILFNPYADVLTQFSLQKKDEYIYELRDKEIFPVRMHIHSLHFSPAQLLSKEGKKVAEILEIYSI